MENQSQSHTFWVDEKYIPSLVLDNWDKLNENEITWVGHFLMSINAPENYSDSYWIISKDNSINTQCAISLEITKCRMMTIVFENGEIE